MDREVSEKETSDREISGRMTYLAGNADIIRAMREIPAREPFDDEIMDFLNEASRILMSMREAKAYPDVVTFAFWIRKASLARLKEQYAGKDGNIRLGRGVAFHIAPSNVAVNYAYSLTAGLITGNANLVRLPSKDFPQVELINRALTQSLEKHPEMKPYVCLIRYERSREINDFLSGMADTRIIWGGDATIAELRKSPLMPRAGEVTFADRFSMAVIDSEFYLEQADWERLAEGFYNDTYLTDQNACTSPRIVVWTGGRKEEAKELFWGKLHKLVKERYPFQPIQGVNKLATGYRLAAVRDGVAIERHEDNLLVRVKVPEITGDLMNYKDNSGYFLEYDCEDITELRALCDDKRCQTIAYAGNKEMFHPLIRFGIRGVDRIVPVGKTMDFEMIWDGYNLFERLTRIIRVL